MFCNYHPFAQLQIAVYAESTGNSEKDKALAKQKAKAIFDYLKQKEVLNPLTFVGALEAKTAKEKQVETKSKNCKVVFTVTSLE